MFKHSLCRGVELCSFCFSSPLLTCHLSSVLLIVHECFCFFWWLIQVIMFVMLVTRLACRKIVEDVFKLIPGSMETRNYSHLLSSFWHRNNCEYCTCVLWELCMNFSSLTQRPNIALCQPENGEAVTVCGHCVSLMSFEYEQIMTSMTLMAWSSHET